jgi:hypothetical protein
MVCEEDIIPPHFYDDVSSGNWLPGQISEDTLMYTIYHVVGVKIGCTTDFERRFHQNKEIYGKDVVIEILEVYPIEVGDKFAGDREWEFADAYGYPRRNHFSQRWNNAISKEQLSENGKKGAKLSLLGKMDETIKPELRAKYGVGFDNNNWYNNSEKHKQDAYRGAMKAVENGKIGMKTKVVCPHCGKSGQTAVMGRWHFDNCKFKAVSVSEVLE